MNKKRKRIHICYTVSYSSTISKKFSVPTSYQVGINIFLTKRLFYCMYNLIDVISRGMNPPISL